jgi:hypothetical protein
LASLHAIGADGIAVGDVQIAVWTNQTALRQQARTRAAGNRRPRRASIRAFVQR